MQIENISLYLKKIELLTGLPVWAIVPILFVCLFLFYLYGVRIPFAILRVRKELMEQSKKLTILVEQQENNNKEYKYTWKD
jgi:hypothetical protein